jgi:hypothetical protein
LIELGNVTSYEDASLADGATYYYKVSAKNLVGEGNKSDEASTNSSTLVGKWILVTWLQDGNLTYMSDTWIEFKSDGTMVSYQQGQTGTALWRDLGSGQMEMTDQTGWSTYLYDIDGDTLVLQGYTWDTHVWVVMTLTRA